MVSRVDMNKWRSIDYEKRLKREVEILKKSGISENNKKLINRYRNHRLAKGVSIARVHRETQSLRLLCERFGVELDGLDQDSIEGLLAELELSDCGLSTINEYKKALKYFLEFSGKTDLSRQIRRKEPKDNRLTRDDLLALTKL